MSTTNICIYQQLLPAAALAPYVECFWLLKAPAQPAREEAGERLPADGRVEVMFHLAGPSKRYRADGEGEPRIQRTSAVLGGRSRGYVVEQIGASHYVSIRFRPGGMAPFLAYPLTEIADQVVDLDVLWGRGVRELEELLLAAHSPEAVARILNSALLKRFEERSHLRSILAARQMIDTSGGNVAIRDLATRSGWSHKHFERLFTQYVGFSPKKYARISRFQQMSIWAAHHRPGMVLGELAATFGYFDQSHFNKDILTFTGVPPGTFFATTNQIVENIYGKELAPAPSV